MLVAMRSAVPSDPPGQTEKAQALLLADARLLRDLPGQTFRIPGTIASDRESEASPAQPLRAWPRLRLSEDMIGDVPVRVRPRDYNAWEEGSRFSVAGLVADEQRSIVGGRIQSIATRLSDSRLLLESRGMWLCEFIQNEAAATSFFSPGDKAVYAMQGLSYGSNWLLLGGGMRWELAGNISAFAGYDAQFNSEAMFHIGSTGLAYQW